MRNFYKYRIVEDACWEKLHSEASNQCWPMNLNACIVENKKWQSTKYHIIKIVQLLYGTAHPHWKQLREISKNCYVRDSITVVLESRVLSVSEEIWVNRKKDQRSTSRFQCPEKKHLEMFAIQIPIILVKELGKKSILPINFK